MPKRKSLFIPASIKAHKLTDESFLLAAQTQWHSVPLPCFHSQHKVDGKKSFTPEKVSFPCEVKAKQFQVRRVDEIWLRWSVK